MALQRITFKAAEKSGHRGPSYIEVDATGANAKALALAIEGHLFAKCSRVATLDRADESGVGGRDKGVGSAISFYGFLTAGAARQRLSIQDVVAGTTADDIATILVGHVHVGRFGGLSDSVSGRLVDLNNG
jgi:hypothetical protein